MFRSARTIEAEAVDRKLTKLREEWQRTAASWFDGSPASVDRRIAKLDAVIAFAGRAQHADGPAGGYAATSLPDMHAQRQELLVVRDRLAGGAWTPPTAPPMMHEDGRPMTTAPETGGRSVDQWTGLPNQISHSEYSRLPQESNQHYEWDQNSPHAQTDPVGGWKHKVRGTGVGPMMGSLRNAAQDFVDGQDTTDRGELLVRAQRFIADRTSTWGREASNDAVRAFVGAVNAEIPEQSAQPQQRMTSYVRDFDDALLFG